MLALVDLNPYNLVSINGESGYLVRMMRKQYHAM